MTRLTVEPAALPPVREDLPPALRAQLAEAQADAARQAAELWATAPTALRLIDTETHALKRAVPIEVHIADGAGEALFHHRINPGRRVKLHNGAVAVHGITKQMLAGSPRFADLADEFERAMGGADTWNIAYNAPFDRQVLARAWVRAALGPLPAYLATDARWWCAMRAWARFNASWDPAKNRYQYLRLGGDHSSAGDVERMGKLLFTMAAAHRRTPHEERVFHVVTSIRAVAPYAAVARVHCTAHPGQHWSTDTTATLYDQDFTPIALAAPDAARLGAEIVLAYPKALWPMPHDLHLGPVRLGRTPGPHRSGTLPAQDRTFGTVFEIRTAAADSTADGNRI